MIWVGIFGVVLVGYAFRDDLSGVAARVFGELVPGSAVVDAEAGTATFRRGRGGHFEVVATRQRRSHSADLRHRRHRRRAHRSAMPRLPASTRRSLSYTIPVATANGTGRAAGVRLDSIEVGGIVRRNIRAFVAEAGALDTSLLGMTYPRDALRAMRSRATRWSSPTDLA